MTFKLQPGDWIPTAEVPEDKRQDVIDAFSVIDKDFNEGDWDIERDFSFWECVGLDGYKVEMWMDVCEVINVNRRVTLDQILGDTLTVNVPEKPTQEMINAMYDAMRDMEDEEYPGHLAKYSVNDMLERVWIAGVNAAKEG
tara:strand:+ start:679 stop:1101 length:423 start_codon:yes stop_codon:yes gene_type:complete